MKIIDCHCHVYPDAIAKKAVNGIAGFYDFEVSDDLLVRGTVSDMLSREKKAGISHAVIFSVATTPHQVSSINRFIAGEAVKSGGSLTGLGTIHPDSENMTADLDEIAALGLKGVKIHPDFQRTAADDERYMRAYEYCEGRLPVLIHCGDSRKDYSNPKRIARIAEKFPRLTIIGAHLGGWSVWNEAIQLLPEYDNFYVDCSSSFAFLGAEKFTETLRAYGAHKTLFGTDYPMWSPDEEVENLLSAGLYPDELEFITHKNAEAVFGI